MEESGQQPIVSAIIPVRNRPEMLRRALDSVLAQSFTRWEAIVVNDGSTDGTAGVAERAARDDTRIRVLHNESAQGASAARNRAITAARGEWVALLDSDDEWLPDRLTDQLAAVDAAPADERPRIGVVYGWYHEREPGGAERLISETHEGSVRAVLLNQVFGPSSTLLIHREPLMECGMFDSRMEGCEEYELLIRLASRVEFRCVRRPVATLHQHPGARHSRQGRGWAVLLDLYGDDLRREHGARALALRRRLCGSLFRAEGRREQALEQFRHSVRAWPFNPGAWARLAATYLSTERPTP